MKVRYWLLPLLLLSLARAGGAENTTATDNQTRAKDSRPLALIVDHLPSFMYAGEKLALSLRIERRPELKAEIPFEIIWQFSGPAMLKTTKSSGLLERVAAKHFTIVSPALPIPNGATAFSYSLRSSGKSLAGGKAIFVGERDKWPAGATAGWGGLVTADGAALILVAEERVAKVDHRFKPLKALLTSGRKRATSLIVAGPRLNDDKRISYSQQLKACAARSDFLLLAGSDYTKPGTTPIRGIHQMAVLIEDQLIPLARKNKTDLIVLVMPPSDPEMATDRRRYRQGLDWLIVRLNTRLGEIRISIVPPLTRSVPLKQRQAYIDICKKSVSVYARSHHASLIDISAFSKRHLWRPTGASEKVTGRFPNEDGHRKLASLIQAACR
jgi:hypothetical protein